MRKFFDPPKENVVTFYLFARTSPWKSMCRAELSCSENYVKILVFFWLCCMQSIIGYEVFVHGQRLESSPLVIFHIPFYLVHVKEEFKTFVIAYLSVNCMFKLGQICEIYIMMNWKHIWKVTTHFIRNGSPKQTKHGEFDWSWRGFSFLIVVLSW